jgi:hypothetical protein
MSFSELENDTLNQSELNEIEINENNQIFAVAGQNENPSTAHIFFTKHPHNWKYLWVTQM